jgi:serine kinase of HPr protein (carbohydrate metabolism regulator)
MGGIDVSHLEVEELGAEGDGKSYLLERHSRLVGDDAIEMHQTRPQELLR